MVVLADEPRCARRCVRPFSHLQRRHCTTSVPCCQVRYLPSSGGRPPRPCGVGEGDRVVTISPPFFLFTTGTSRWCRFTPAPMRLRRCVAVLPPDLGEAPFRRQKERGHPARIPAAPNAGCRCGEGGQRKCGCKANSSAGGGIPLGIVAGTCFLPMKMGPTIAGRRVRVTGGTRTSRSLRAVRRRSTGYTHGPSHERLWRFLRTPSRQHHTTAAAAMAGSGTMENELSKKTRFVVLPAWSIAAMRRT